MAKIFFTRFKNNTENVERKNMQVNRCDSNINFGRITSIKCKGLFKKSPQSCQAILDVFKRNETARNFCAIHDVDITLTAANNEFRREYTISKLIMMYKDLAPEGGIISKLLHKIRRPKRIEVMDCGLGFNKSAECLKNAILPKNESIKNSGKLDYSIEEALSKENKVKEAKLEKERRKEKKLKEEQANRDALVTLRETIEDLKNNT